MAVSFKVIRNGSPGQTGVTVLVRRESCHGVVVALLGAGEGEAGVDLPGLAWPLEGWVSASPVPWVLG